MENLVNLDVNAVLDWLNTNSNSDSSMWTKYVNKIENVSFKWNNLNITITTKRSFKDYIYGFIFFVMRCIVIFLIPVYLISIFWLNFTNSFVNIKDNLSENVGTSFDLSKTESIFGQSNPVNDYIWLMDELLGG